jgi:hypothetical protein
VKISIKENVTEHKDKPRQFVNDTLFYRIVKWQRDQLPNSNASVSGLNHHHNKGATHSISVTNETTQSSARHSYSTSGDTKDSRYTRDEIGPKAVEVFAEELRVRRINRCSTRDESLEDILKPIKAMPFKENALDI